MSRTEHRVPDRERILASVCLLGLWLEHAVPPREPTYAMMLTCTVGLQWRIRHCKAACCTSLQKPYCSEAEGALALQQHEFGLDIVVVVGILRHQERRSVLEIPSVPRGSGVTNLLDRYDAILKVRQELGNLSPDYFDPIIRKATRTAL